MMARILALGIALLFITNVGIAQEFRALARALQGGQITSQADRVRVELPISQAVPFRIYTLAQPNRLVFEFNEVDFAGFDADALASNSYAKTVLAGPIHSGWSRLVVELASPILLVDAEMASNADQSAQLNANFRLVDQETFVAASQLPQSVTDKPDKALVPVDPARRRSADDPIRVVLDPGHGGIDPGAEVDGDIEAHSMLRFAKDLREVLLRTGGFEVKLTRDDDIFVPLESRIAIAHRFNADVFVSLHADVVTEGNAHGATIYTLSDEASDIASQKLAERHDRTELLSGVDLSAQDDVVAFVLMDMARTDTRHRSGTLADTLVDQLSRKVELYKKPRLSAGFSVLKSPDIPSVLVELGFMSSKRDLENLRNPEWRKRAAIGIRDALVKWGQNDLAEQELRRK